MCSSDLSGIGVRRAGPSAIRAAAESGDVVDAVLGVVGLVFDEDSIVGRERDTIERVGCSTGQRDVRAHRAGDGWRLDHQASGGSIDVALVRCVGGVDRRR